MTNDELLSKLLDNSLTEAERQDLDARMASSPHFAEEVREFLAVEELLTKAKPHLASAPQHLLNTVEQRTVSTIAANASATTLASSHTSSTLQQWIAPAIAVLVIGSTAVISLLWLANGTTPTPSAPVAVHTTTTDGSTPTAPEYTAPQQQYTPAHEQQEGNAAIPSHTEGRTPTASHRATENNVVEAPPISAPKPNRANPQEDTENQFVQAQTPAVLQQRTQETKNTRDTFSMTKLADTPEKQELQRQMEKYTSAQTEGNHIEQMSAAKKIGILLREIKEYKGSSKYLEIARELAHSLRLEEDEALAIGELGLLEKAQGNTSKAVQLLQQCVATLEKLQSPFLQRWKEEIKKL